MTPRRPIRLMEAIDAYADKLDEKVFALSFEFETDNGITMALDRPTLERLQSQIAFALSPQAQPVDRSSEIDP